MTSALQNRVLVLNKSWQAIDVTTARHAVTKVYQDSAKVVEPVTYAMHDFDSWMDFSITTWADAKAIAQSDFAWLNGIGFKLMVPEIVVMRDYAGFNKREVKFSRKNIFERDNYTCQYCGRRLPTKELTIDHVLPRSRGGKSVWKNVVLACYSCNRRKDNKTPEEARMKLLKTPERPHWTQVKTFARGEIPKSWEDFLGEMYWNIRLKEE